MTIPCASASRARVERFLQSFEASWIAWEALLELTREHLEKLGLRRGPLTLDQALGGAMATGKPAQKKRTATKRKRKGEDEPEKKPPRKRGRKPGPAKRG